MNKLEINGIQNLKGFAVNGWEIYEIRENENSYYLKVRPEKDYENAKHAQVQFDKKFIIDPSSKEYGGKLIRTLICYESLRNQIHDENVYYNLFKKKNDLWQGIVNIIITKGVNVYGR